MQKSKQRQKQQENGPKPPQKNIENEKKQNEIEKAKKTR